MILMSTIWSLIVVLTVDQQCDVGISSGDLRGLYLLDELHFHWGSEHTIDNKRYALELHLVHHKNNYPSKENALNYTQGIAVLGVLFHESEEDNPVLNQLVESLEKVVKTEMSTQLEKPFSPLQLLPEERSHFFRYYGSLTTPPCSESVVWTVFKTSLPISKSQIKHFYNIDSAVGSLGHNFRKIQPLNERKVYFLCDEKTGLGSASSLISNNSTHLLFKMFVLIYYISNQFGNKLYSF
uniref:Carbonic anhydrase n=1 Tax=Clastoptera arizonana TaxID=38151 RepID=A0A1B6C2W2_9HEMI